MQPARTGEGALDPRGQRLGQLQRIDEGGEEADVAELERQVFASAGRSRAPRQAGDLGVALRRRAGLERLQPDLQELLVGFTAPGRGAERLALVEIASAGAAAFDVQPRGRDGEVWPQRR